VTIQAGPELRFRHALLRNFRSTLSCFSDWLKSTDCSTFTFTPNFLIAGENVDAPNAFLAPALETGWVFFGQGVKTPGYYICRPQGAGYVNILILPLTCFS
jgi:hypothetical protein